MSFIFASGGGRLGNQLLNVIHLTAIAIEKNVIIYKINDNYLTNEDHSFFNFFFNISENNSNWTIFKCNLNNSFQRKLNNFRFRFFVRLLHFIFYLYPSRLSFKYSSSQARTKFILATRINEEDELKTLFFKSMNKDLIFSGWGIRNWNLVIKHKKKIRKILTNKLLSDKITLKSNNENRFILVHIRNSDFAKYYPFKKLVYDSNLWIKSIAEVCRRENVNKVKIFTDDFKLEKIKNNLASQNIKVINPSYQNNNEFLLEFIEDSKTSTSILCNSSSLTLYGICFQRICLTPDYKKICKLCLIDDMHKTNPHSINWT